MTIEIITKQLTVSMHSDKSCLSIDKIFNMLFPLQIEQIPRSEFQHQTRLIMIGNKQEQLIPARFPLPAQTDLSLKNKDIYFDNTAKGDPLIQIQQTRQKGKDSRPEKNVLNKTIKILK